MASNIQRGPRQMDASDWTRIKKLSGARGNMLYSYTPTSPATPIGYEDTINPSPVNCCVSVKNNRHVYPEFGISRIRRPASHYTDYIASRSADFILETTDLSTGGKILTQTQICDCGPRYRLTGISYTVTSINGNNGNIVLPISWPEDATTVIFTSGLTCGVGSLYTVYYVKTILPPRTIRLSATPDGSVILFTSGCAGSTIHIVTIDSPLKHGGLCLKCTYDPIEKN